jgi:hypothetical protein
MLILDILEASLKEAKLGSKVEYTKHSLWKKDLPPKADCKKDGKIERAQAIGKDFEGVAGEWNSTEATGWIYSYYLKKENLTEDATDDKFNRSLAKIQVGLAELGKLPERRYLRTQVAALNQVKRDLDALIKKIAP